MNFRKQLLALLFLLPFAAVAQEDAINWGAYYATLVLLLGGPALWALLLVVLLYKRRNGKNTDIIFSLFIVYTFLLIIGLLVFFSGTL
jgi:hypothetical protein